MFKIIDRYLLRTFIPLFVMSFVVCWFLVVMQFLWRYVEELVGKGLSGSMLVEIVFYAALTMIPLSLPLGILLSSLMVMGNLGERLELLSMKASGMRLYRIIRPLVMVVSLMAVGLFFFSNDLMIRTQVRMWSLVLTAKYTAPEMEITPGVFYTGIPNYSLYAQERDPNGRLRHLMVYDMSRGYLAPRIIRADSGRLVMDESKTFLILKLYNGQNFEVLRAPLSNTSSEPTPYMLPRFSYNEILIHFNANVQEQDQGYLQGMYIGKNLSQLQIAIDSTTRILDSARTAQADQVRTTLQRGHYGYITYDREDSLAQRRYQERITELQQRYQGGDRQEVARQLSRLTTQDSLSALYTALDRAQQESSLAELVAQNDEHNFYSYRTFRQEWHRKWTASVSCIIFCLIGASLGAIVRRGGIGMPILISIFFFVVYFIIDSFGVNLVRSGDIVPWLGMWLSNLLLAPVAVFLVYKANQDSSALNVEAYVVFFRKLLGFRGVRHVNYQEILLEEANYHQGLALIEEAKGQTEALLAAPLLAAPLWSIWRYADTQQELAQLSEGLDGLTEHLRHTSSRLLVSKLGDLPLLPTRFSRLLPTSRRWAILLGLCLPLSLPLLFFFARVRSQLRADLRSTRSTLLQLAEETTKAIASQPSPSTDTYPPSPSSLSEEVFPS